MVRTMLRRIVFWSGALGGGVLRGAGVVGGRDDADLAAVGGCCVAG